MGRPRIPPADRINNHTQRDLDGCLVWTGGQARGYGKITIPRDGEDWANGLRTTTAHIVAWELEHGPVPAGFQIDHLCRNPLCCDVTHLRLLDPVVNVMIGNGPPALNARKVVCSRGHDDWKSYEYRGHTWRQCRTCAREHVRAYRQRRRVGARR
jgi:hypothetical protein